MRRNRFAINAVDPAGTRARTPGGDGRARRPGRAPAEGRAEAGADARVLRFGTYEIDTARLELRRDGTRVPLEPRAFHLLLLLARNGDRVVTKDEIFGSVWGGLIVSDAALSSQIKAVRQALGDDGVSQHTIATAYGRGFRFMRRIEPAGTVPGSAPARAGAERPKVAVLPFRELGEDSATFLADGISTDIITALSKNRSLRVVARSPSFAFRDSTDPIPVIGAKLGADYIVTGSVQRAGSRVRTTVETVVARSARSLWSERFDCGDENVFELQDEISGVAAARIANELGSAEQQKAERRPCTNRGAWDLHQLGTAEFYRFTPDSNQRCQDLLREAIRLAPRFAQPHALLAYAIVLNMVYFESPIERAAMDEALALALRAVALDDQDAHCWFALGRVRLVRRDYDLAIDALEQALALNPCLAVGYCGLGDSLAYADRLDEAIRQFEIAIDLSPYDPFRWAFFSYRSLAHLFRHDFADAARWARRAVQVPNAHYWARVHLLAAVGHLGNARQAATARAELMRARPGFTRDLARQRLFFVDAEHQIRTYLDGLAKAGLP